MAERLFTRPGALKVIRSKPFSFDVADADGRLAANVSSAISRVALPPGVYRLDTGAEIVELLRVLNRDERLTIVMVTHNLDLVAATDRVVRIASGRIELPVPANGPPLALLSEAC